jgi:APA family basic amino acid/polyamine antiporter
MKPSEQAARSTQQGIEQHSAATHTQRAFGTLQATALVMAAMIGTGVFTSLGMQLRTIPSAAAVLVLWIAGGLSSLCGALAYAELGAAYPRSGGEYHLLSVIYSRRLGFVAGVATLVAGLAAPIAVSAVAFSKYMQHFVHMPPVVLSVGAVLAATLLHSIHVRTGAALHSGITYFNVGLIVVFIGAAFVFGASGESAPTVNAALHIIPNASDFSLMLSPFYAIAFVYVSYSYLGWNSSVYILDEVRTPQRTLPRSVISGVLLVTVLYVALNYAFLRSAPLEVLSGKVDVGHYVASALFGERGAVLMSALISLALFASVSSYVVMGPRIWKVMGDDYVLFRPAARTNHQGIPIVAFWLQAVIALIMVLTATFEAILVYAGFILSVFNILAVFGVFLLRQRHPKGERPYKAFGYPVTPMVFVLVSTWMVLYGVVERPVESACVIGTLALAYILSWWNERKRAQY